LSGETHEAFHLRTALRERRAIERGVAGQKEMIEIIAPDGATVRLDVFLVHHFPALSRRRARELVAGGAVQLNGRRARKGDAVHPNDLVRVCDRISLKPPHLSPQEELQIPILYEDAAIVAIAKPAEMPAHALRSGEEGTAANFLIARYAEVASAGKSVLEAGLVHRLDTATSGVMLAARDPDSYRRLRKMFGSDQVAKLYLAIVAGDVSGRGRVTTPIAHAPHNPRRMCVCPSTAQARSLQARPAVTVYRALRRFSVATFLAVKISTGVRHQIRVHLASVGHPVLGDRLYSSKDEEPLDTTRLLLHAARIRLRRPDTGGVLTVNAPLPEDFRDAIRHLESAAWQERAVRAR
jgi:23S rRNA pseudouridine1911/1915/1917 synthase